LCGLGLHSDLRGHHSDRAQAAQRSFAGRHHGRGDLCPGEPLTTEACGLHLDLTVFDSAGPFRAGTSCPRKSFVRVGAVVQRAVILLRSGLTRTLLTNSQRQAITKRTAPAITTMTAGSRTEAQDATAPEKSGLSTAPRMMVAVANTMAMEEMIANPCAKRADCRNPYSTKATRGGRAA